jgi:peptidoglycan L-alanyl-D-glutamate endopeptidase CwlK
MDLLQEGASGPQVVTLQTKLKERGFSPGTIDGNFGPGTQAALLAFQKSQGLLADGVVGSSTAAALGFEAADVPAPPPMPNVTLGIVAKMFPFTPLDNINDNLPHVLAALQAAGLTDLPIVLAALATIRAETEGFVPIPEGISRFNTSPGGHPFDLYDHRADLGNQGPPDGASFKGRGYVQLTGRVNYVQFGPLVRVPNLVGTPDQASDPDVAARLLVAFISSRRIRIKQALLEGDLATARRQVNGGSNGLDRFSEAYTVGMRLLGS